MHAYNVFYFVRNFSLAFFFILTPFYSRPSLLVGLYLIKRIPREATLDFQDGTAVVATQAAPVLYIILCTYYNIIINICTTVRVRQR